jgi:hypothetical protein
LFSWKVLNSSNPIEKAKLILLGSKIHDPEMANQQPIIINIIHHREFLLHRNQISMRIQ